MEHCKFLKEEIELNKGKKTLKHLRVTGTVNESSFKNTFHDHNKKNKIPGN